MRLVAVCWIGQSPWRGEVWDLFRSLNNKTIYVKLRHHYFVTVLQACTVYYAHDQQGWVFLIFFCSCFHAKCTFLLRLTDKNQQCCFVCQLVSRWKAQLNVILLTIGSQVYPFCAIGIWQNKFVFVFNNHILLPVMRSDKTWKASELDRLQGGSFITLLQSGNHQI